jgi:hypothetical protein
MVEMMEDDVVTYHRVLEKDCLLCGGLTTLPPPDDIYGLIQSQFGRYYIVNSIYLLSRMIIITTVPRVKAEYKRSLSIPC